MSLSRIGNVILRVGLVALTLTHSSSASTVHFRLPASPGYQGRDVCPARCAVSGPVSGNWSLYHNLEQIATCGETIFYDFTLVDKVDDPSTLHRIYACTSFGPDWANLSPNTTGTASAPSATRTNVNYQIGYWPNANGSSVAADTAIVVSQMRQYISNGFARSDGPVVLLASAGTGAVGLFIGKGIQNEIIGSSALQDLENVVLASNLNNTASLAMQYCQPNQTADHVFGLIATGNGTFGTVQNTLASWANASCLSLPQVSNVTGPIILNTPLFHPANSTSNSTSSNSTSTAKSPHFRLSRRGQCSTVQVVSGDSCASLAKKCGISGSDFTKYNPDSNFCSTLKPYQHVCCSAGTLPDFAPKPNSDGSCATYTVKANDNCANLAAEYSLTNDQIESFNKETWAWNGCAELYIGTIICLSTGTPPMPAALSNAVCGPQKPGTPVPPSGTNISSLNPCPLNACCDVWGQCGVTAEFCTNTGTGAPGTAKPGTNGCISNCGTNIIRSSPPSEYRSVAFFEGYNLGRFCLYQSASQIDASSYTHLFYSFGTLDTNYQVQVGDVLSTYEFKEFLRISGPKKILSIGGWAFSTDPSTYMIFRNGVTAANRQAMANNIANFVKSNNLDGVNIDWEYPGAQDIPGIPAASLDDGTNYLSFLALLRNLLPNKEISVAAPASYWYLRGFPIQKMSNVLDYVIYMTYDLHGQWDANNQWSQIGCPTGTCLRSDVNLTETIGALVMITKAGVPSNKVVVGVTSYGRSFAMADAGCYGPECTYLGSASDSQATPGICTQTAGYISNAEINDIISNSSRVNQHFIDPTSNSNILVYDDTQWVGWMDDNIKASRATTYKNLAMGGITDWATDLQKYNDPPPRAGSWKQFLADVKVGTDPAKVGPRTGNWTTLTCSDPSVTDIRDLTPQQRWNQMDCPDAWSNAIAVWNTVDKGHDSLTFTESIADTLHLPEDADCGLVNGHCGPDTIQCFTADGSGPAAYEIWNSFVTINSIYSNYITALNGAAASVIDNALDSFEDTFAPIPPPPDDEWIQLLIAVVTLGASFIAAPFFNSVFKALPYFAERGEQLGILKDDTSALITFGSNVAKDVITPSNQNTWNVTQQHQFSAYLGQAIFGWTKATEDALQHLFDGSTDSISTLSTIIQDGQLIEGNTGSPNPVTTSDGTMSDLEASIATAFWGFAIPAVWYAAGTAAFIIDSGYPCGTVDPISQYMDTDTMHAMAGCYNNELYYLAYPKGDATQCTSSKAKRCPGCDPPPPDCGPAQFQAPPGSETLDGNAWGGVTVGQLIKGSVRTYIANGNQNGGPVADPASQGTIADLQNQDFTTPGYIRMPVCSPAVAYRAWSNPSQVDKSDPNYPCVQLQGVTDCKDYTFEDQTSDGSPSVSDCMAIINNIEGTNGEWNTGIGSQRDIAKAGSCNFGVQNSGTTGDVTFKTGSQDIVNIINQAVKNWGGGGKVGAKGTMTCSGDVNDQKVNWGLY